MFSQAQFVSKIWFNSELKLIGISHLSSPLLSLLLLPCHHYFYKISPKGLLFSETAHSKSILGRNFLQGKHNLQVCNSICNIANFFMLYLTKKLHPLESLLSFTSSKLNSPFSVHDFPRTNKPSLPDSRK